MYLFLVSECQLFIIFRKKIRLSGSCVSATRAPLKCTTKIHPQRPLLGNRTLKKGKNNVRLLNCRHTEFTQPHIALPMKSRSRSFLNVSTVQDEPWPFARVHSVSVKRAIENCWASLSVLSKRNQHVSAWSLGNLSLEDLSMQEPPPLLFFCFSTPEGKWIRRFQLQVQQHPQSDHGSVSCCVPVESLFLQCCICTWL